MGSYLSRKYPLLLGKSMFLNYFDLCFRESSRLLTERITEAGETGTLRFSTFDFNSAFYAETAKYSFESDNKRKKTNKEKKCINQNSSTLTLAVRRQRPAH